MGELGGHARPDGGGSAAVGCVGGPAGGGGAAWGGGGAGASPMAAFSNDGKSTGLSVPARAALEKDGLSCQR